MLKSKEKNNASFRCWVKNKTDTSADLYFYGDIVSDKAYKWSSDDKCPTDVIEALNECGDVDKLNIYINSCGGNVFAGNAIYNRLRSHTAHKTVFIDGVAASIASVIALAGDEIVMPENSYIMIHKAWTYAVGNSDDLRASADRLEQIEQSIVTTYNSHTKEDVNEEKIKSLMAAETWFSAAEASEFFNDVTVVEETSAVACISNMEYKNIPQGAVKAPQAETIPPETGGDSEQKKEKEIENSLNLAENFIFMEECEDEQKNA